jgi:hypothetical protein
MEVAPSQVAPSQAFNLYELITIAWMILFFRDQPGYHLVEGEVEEAAPALSFPLKYKYKFDESLIDGSSDEEAPFMQGDLRVVSDPHVITPKNAYYHDCFIFCCCYCCIFCVHVNGPPRPYEVARHEACKFFSFYFLRGICGDIYYKLCTKVFMSFTFSAITSFLLITFIFDFTVASSVFSALSTFYGVFCYFRRYYNWGSRTYEDYVIGIALADDPVAYDAVHHPRHIANWHAVTEFSRASSDFFSDLYLFCSACGTLACSFAKCCCICCSCCVRRAPALVAGVHNHDPNRHPFAWQ